MPICAGCGASYSDSFSFCPHCGREKPEPSTFTINVEVSRQRYEEAGLKIDLVRKEAINDYPFDYKPNVIDVVFGGSGRNWKEVRFYKLILISTHPTKGEYKAYESQAFRAFHASLKSKFVLPTVVKNSLWHQPEGREWIKRFFFEREEVWNDYNQYLIQDYWIGLTDTAVIRTPPFELEFDWSGSESQLFMNGFLTIGRYEPLDQLAKNYRYYRQTD